MRDTAWRRGFCPSVHGRCPDAHNAYLKRKALTAITAKMARIAHAVIRTGSDYRPFFEGPMPSGGHNETSKFLRC
jgi:hypothetical protein